MELEFNDGVVIKGVSGCYFEGLLSATPISVLGSIEAEKANIRYKKECDVFDAQDKDSWLYAEKICAGR